RAPAGAEFAQTAEFKSRPRNFSSTVALCDHFLGPNQLPAPDESALHAHHDGAVLFRKIGGLVVDDTMARAIVPFPRLNFLHIEAMQDFNQRMNGVLQIIAPLGDAVALPLLVRNI